MRTSQAALYRGGQAARADAQNGDPGAHGGRGRLGSSVYVGLRVGSPETVVAMAGGCAGLESVALDVAAALGTGRSPAPLAPVPGVL